MPTIKNIADFITRIPKAELHIHLEGSIEPEMMFYLADRNKIRLQWAAPDALRKDYNFNNLQSFLEVYYSGCNVLVTSEDFYAITKAYLERAVRDGVLRTEVFFGPQSFTEKGIVIDEIMQGILYAIKEIEKLHKISVGLLISAQRHRTEAAAVDLVKAVEPWYENIAGFGLGGAEIGNPPSKFINYFEECRKCGFKTTIHAGEEGPVNYVEEAAYLLKVDRIDHGNTAIESPKLIDHLAVNKIPLTLCPVSNLKLKSIETIKQSPLKEMLDAGLIVTVNSDDPSYFNSYIADAWICCVQELNLTIEQIITLSKNSFSAAFISENDKNYYHTMIDEFVEGYY
ncbi:MAG: adenosine deaminase [Spirochaetales bacterium]|jgi:adenosine deaminase|nr:adenosine deaminase [Spirochaetales bacterium]